MLRLLYKEITFLWQDLPPYSVTYDCNEMKQAVIKKGCYENIFAYCLYESND